MSKELIDNIKKYLEKVNNIYKIDKAFIYGSQISKTADEQSDIDIALVSSAFSGDRFKDNVNAGILTWGIDTRIEPITFRPEDFNEDNIIASEIIKNGEEISIF
jgi:predicted nucleotidyltransferase